MESDADGCVAGCVELVTWRVMWRVGFLVMWGVGFLVMWRVMWIAMWRVGVCRVT